MVITLSALPPFDLLLDLLLIILHPVDLLILPILTSLFLLRVIPLLPELGRSPYRLALLTLVFHPSVGCPEFNFTSGSYGRRLTCRSRFLFYILLLLPYFYLQGGFGGVGVLPFTLPSRLSQVWLALPDLGCLPTSILYSAPHHIFL